MRIKQSALLLPVLTLGSLCADQAHDPSKKYLLGVGEEKGYRHGSVSRALATIAPLGEKTGRWNTTSRTDTEAPRKKKLAFNAKNLDDFDTVLFFTGGKREIDAQQKADLLSFVHDDGRGFIGVPRLQEMYIGAIKWAMGWVDVNVTSRPRPCK